MEDEELVTVIIPAADEERSIGACLDSVLAQDHRNLQVVVVDGASADRTSDIVKSRISSDARVELVHNPRRLIPSSLNMALTHARGRWLVRVDAHSTIPPGYVRHAVARLREGGWGGVGGRKDAVGLTPAGRAIAVALSSPLGVGGSTYHHGTAVQEVDHVPFGAYPTDVVRSVGGWDETLAANEDFEFDYRLRQAGHTLLFDPAMSIAWEGRQSVRDLFRQYHRYGKGKADVTLLHPRSLSLRHVVPPAFVVYLTGVAAYGVRHPSRAAGLLSPYAAVVLAESVRCRDRLDTVEERLHLPASFVAMHVGWGLGFWTRLGQRLRGQ